MARKATARSTHARGTRPRKKVAAPAAAAARRATIRMYRLGVGDCFLVSFPQDGREDFRILIDENIPAAIDQFIKETNAELLTTFTHHLNLFEKLFALSVTRTLAYQGNIPLLALKRK